MNKRPELADYHELIPLIDNIYRQFGQGHCWHEAFDGRIFSKTMLRYCAEKARVSNCGMCSALIQYVESASKLQFKKAVTHKSFCRPGERRPPTVTYLKKLAARVNPT